MDAVTRSEALAAYAAETAGCVRCRLAETRSQVVFGSGNPDAELMIVGEAPGYHEDQGGLPFAGQAGELLARLLAGIGLAPESVYLANVLKCRPPQNRDPLEAEIAACEPHLFRQIELVRPRVVATLGNFATKLLSGRSFGITRVHGQEQEVTLASTTVLLYPLYHPAAALYTPSMLKALEDDFARLPALLGHADGDAGRARTARLAARAGSPDAGRGSRPPEVEARWSARFSSASSDRVIELITQSAAETEAFGGTIAGLLRPGDVVLLRGELGSGKTTLVRGACRSLGIEEPVTSPTFTIGHLYHGTATVAHLDLYRFVGLSAAEWGDLEPYFDGTIAFVEWPEAGVAALPPARLALELEHVTPDERRISADSADRTLLEDLARADPRVRHRN